VLAELQMVKEETDKKLQQINEGLQQINKELLEQQQMKRDIQKALDSKRCDDIFLYLLYCIIVSLIFFSNAKE